MTIIVLTPVRLFGDGLGACLGRRASITVDAVVNDLASLRERLSNTAVDIVLVDVTQATSPFEIRSIAVQWPHVKLIALGLREEKYEVIRAGRSGFAGYLSRDATLDALCQSLSELAAGRVAMPPEISGGLLQALFRPQPAPDAADPDVPLTRREGEVLALLGQGLSNKEIGSHLCLSVATVKHHVHHVLEKLKLPRRAQAMRRVRDAPWLGQTSVSGRK
jgi:two-component system, NarL family, nitrate/nitrite response regulator NarL